MGLNQSSRAPWRPLDTSLQGSQQVTGGSSDTPAPRNEVPPESSQLYCISPLQRIRRAASSLERWGFAFLLGGILGDSGKTFSVPLGQAVVPRELLWQGGRARSGTERGDSGARLGASQGVCSPLPGSCAGSVLHELGISKHLGEPGEAPARLPSQGAGG